MTTEHTPSPQPGEFPGEAVSFRAAAPQDARAMRDLVQATFKPYIERIGREPAPMLEDWDALASGLRAGAETTLAWQERRLVGLLYVQRESDHLLVDTVAVAASARGLGLGARLLALAESRTLALGLNEVRLYTNQAMTENLEYYPRRGYEEVDRRSEAGFTRVFFTKTLSKRDESQARTATPRRRASTTRADGA